jgi:hypothetical protein
MRMIVKRSILVHFLSHSLNFYFHTLNHIYNIRFQDKLGLSQLPPVAILPLGKCL